MSTKKAKFCFNNWIASDATYSTSSALANNPASNLVSGVRSKTWQASNVFEISSQNNKVYINGTTYTLTVGTYTSSTLITHFNSVTSQTLTRNSLGRFVITLGASGTLNLSTTTNAVWSTLGFLGSSNLTGTVFTADERRYTTGEWIRVDVGVPQIPHFACLIPPAETVFSAPTGSVYLQGNNVLDWANPEVNLAMSVTDAGAFLNVPEDTTSACRYWRVFVDDPKNNSISASVCYIGDSIYTQNTNVAVGFSRTKVDPSNRLYSEGGQLYVDRRTRYTTLSSVSIMYLKGQDLIDMEQLVYDLGVGRPFFIVMDPMNEVSTSLSQMTHYVQVDGDASLTHVLNSYYNLSLTLREVI